MSKTVNCAIEDKMINNATSLAVKEAQSVQVQETWKQKMTQTAQCTSEEARRWYTAYIVLALNNVDNVCVCASLSSEVR